MSDRIKDHFDLTNNEVELLECLADSNYKDALDTDFEGHEQRRFSLIRNLKHDEKTLNKLIERLGG